jgi:hypothetical protein
MTWHKKPVWDPAAWRWMTTMEGEETESTEAIDRLGHLISVRSFTEKNRGAAIEILVDFEKKVHSAVIRLDDPTAIPDLVKVLESFRGYSLREIGNAELANLSSRIMLKRKTPEPELY